MTTVKEGREEQWRRFLLSPDVPLALASYTRNVADQIESRLRAGQNFDDAARAVFTESDDSGLSNLDRPLGSVLIVLLDIWVHEPELRLWLNKQVDEAFDAIFPVPPPKERRANCYW